MQRPSKISRPGFADANNAMWFSDNNGFVSYFVKDGYGDRVFYDKKGHWQYSLIFYGEDKLPRDVRAAIKSTYFDMSITLVEEVQTPSIPKFISFTWKTNQISRF